MGSMMEFPSTMRRAARNGALIAAALATLSLVVPAQAADEMLPPKDVSFGFEGPFGVFDRAQLQRGYRVYVEVCSGCHSIDLLAFRNLGDAGGPQFPQA